MITLDGILKCKGKILCDLHICSKKLGFPAVLNSFVKLLGPATFSLPRHWDLIHLAAEECEHSWCDLEGHVHFHQDEARKSKGNLVEEMISPMEPPTFVGVGSW